ncbi:MFS transporter [Nonomuraea sp. NPDC049784]|uniref:MFS transporter n=1 Tax=Nonomuraea sp. NPDC049784 TaxID=3154361 RepID=UPI0033E97A1F
MSGKRSLWRHRDFVLLWSGQSASMLGSEVTLLALPLVAGVVLGASPFEMGVVAAARKLPVLFVSLPAGALADRWRKRPVMICTHLIAGTAMVSIPVAGMFDGLTLGQLYAVAAVAGICETLFNPVYQSYPLIVLGPDRLVEGNAKLSLAMTGAMTVGASLGGVLVDLVGAVRAMLADAISFFVAALAIWSIRTPEPKPEPKPDARMWKEIAEGLRYVYTNRLIRPIAVSGPIFSFTLAGTNALGIIYATQELRWPPYVTGLVLGLSSLGGVLGGLLAHRVIARLGIARTVLWSSLVYAVGDFPLVLVSPGLAGAIVVGAGWTVLLVGAILVQISQRSLRQLITPSDLQGRLAATTRWLSWGSAPLGALLAGAVAEVIGMRMTLLAAAILVGLGPLTLWLSPLRTMKQDPVVATGVT